MSITLFVSYLLLIIYSFRNGIMAPRYIIFLVPIIIIFISTGLEKIDFEYRNYLYTIIALLSAITLLYKIDDSPIKKPPTQKIIGIISASNIKNVTTNINNTKLFTNYLISHKSFYANQLNLYSFQQVALQN